MTMKFNFSRALAKYQPLRRELEDAGLTITEFPAFEAGDALGVSLGTTGRNPRSLLIYERPTGRYIRCRLEIYRIAAQNDIISLCLDLVSRVSLNLQIFDSNTVLKYGLENVPFDTWMQMESAAQYASWRNKG